MSGNIHTTKKIKVVKSSHMKHRGLNDVPYEALKPFLHNDLASVLGRYMNHSVKRAEFVRLFGNKGGKLNIMAKKIVEEFRQTNNNKINENQVIDFIYDIAETLQGTYKSIENRFLHTTNRFLLNLGVVTFLPRVLLSSLPETFTVGANLHGNSKNVAKAYMHAVHDGMVEIAGVTQRLVTGKRSIKKTEAREFAETIGLVSNQAILDAIGSQFGTKDSKVTAVFMKATLLQQLTNLQKIAAASAFKMQSKDWVKQAINNDAHAIQQLKRYGISKEEAIKYKDSNFTDSDINMKIEMGAQRFGMNTITTPRETTRSLLLQNPKFALFFQFQSFTNTFSNTFLKQLYSHHKCITKFN